MEWLGEGGENWKPITSWLSKVRRHEACCGGGSTEYAWFLPIPTFGFAGCILPCTLVELLYRSYRQVLHTTIHLTGWLFGCFCQHFHCEPRWCLTVSHCHRASESLAICSFWHIAECRKVCGSLSLFWSKNGRTFLFPILLIRTVELCRVTLGIVLSDQAWSDIILWSWN